MKIINVFCDKQRKIQALFIINKVFNECFKASKEFYSGVSTSSVIFHKVPLYVSKFTRTIMKKPFNNVEAKNFRVKTCIQLIAYFKITLFKRFSIFSRKKIKRIAYNFVLSRNAFSSHCK